MHAQLTITLTEDGRISMQVAGPHGQNKIVLLGLMEAAKEMLHKPQEEKPTIMVARGSLNGV